MPLGVGRKNDHRRIAVLQPLVIELFQLRLLAAFFDAENVGIELRIENDLRDHPQVFVDIGAQAGS